MCKIYSASPETTEGLMGLAKETRAHGWWHSYGDVIPERFDVYIGLEEAAVANALFKTARCQAPRAGRPAPWRDRSSWLTSCLHSGRSGITSTSYRDGWILDAVAQRRGRGQVWVKTIGASTLARNVTAPRWL